MSVDRQSVARKSASSQSSRTRWRFASGIGAIAAAALLSACGTQQPTVGMSAPSVYTLAHVQLAQLEYAQQTQKDPLLAQSRAKTLSSFADLQRYFASSTSAYAAGKLRADEMLDQVQGSDSYLSSIATALAIKARIGEGDLPGASGLIKGASDPTEIDAADLAAMQAAFAATPTDSPTDRLERAKSFFASYVLSILSLYGRDTRAMDLSALDPIRSFGAYAGGLSETLRSEAKVKAVIDAVEAATLRADAIDRYVANPDPSIRQPYLVAGATPSFNDSVSSLRISWLEINNLKKKADDAAKAVEDKQLEIKKLTARQTLAKQEFTEAESLYALGKFDKERELLLSRLDARKTELVKSVGLSEAAADEFRELTKAATVTKGTLEQAQSRFNSAKQLVNEKVFASASSLARTYLANESAAVIASAGNRQRLLLVLFQPHVEPGNMPDRIAALKVRVKSADTGAACPLAAMASHTQANACPQCLSGSASKVQVLHVHPSRNYDLNDERLLAERNSSAALALAATVPAEGAGEIDAEAKERQEARQRFLARVNKTASWANVPDGNTSGPEFGWYFYPSNVRVTKRTWAGALIGQDAYQSDGFIEAGGRDCAVWLLVPANVKTITFETTTMSGRVDEGSYKKPDDLCRSIIVELPDYSPLEGVSIAGRPVSASSSPPLPSIPVNPLFDLK